MQFSLKIVVFYKEQFFKSSSNLFWIYIHSIETRYQKLKYNLFALNFHFGKPI